MMNITYEMLYIGAWLFWTTERLKKLLNDDVKNEKKNAHSQQIELNVGNARFINDSMKYQQANGILTSTYML